MRSSSIAVLLALMAVAPAQPFGRFGYTDSPSVPGLLVDSEGFRADFASADRVRFPKKSPLWRVQETDDAHQVIALAQGYGQPTKLRVDLTGPGFSLYYPQDVVLKFSTTRAPMLTWPEGSAGANVPTPDVPWLAVSFTDPQPALILGVTGKLASFQITGRAGDWTLTGKRVASWLRVGLATGTRAVSATTAASLGQLAQAAQKQASLFTQLPPALPVPQLKADLQSVTATWRFERPGAVVPVAFALAPWGGYRCAILSPTTAIEAPTEEGPLQVCRSNELRVRFPIRRVPTGRSIALNPPDVEPIGTVSPFDVPSVVSLGLDNLVSTRDSLSRKAAEDAYSEFLGTAAYGLEPLTKQRLPFDQTGKGIDLAAAHALLMQSITSTLRPTSEENSLLTSVSWRRDWLSGRLWLPDNDLARRSAALSAVAGALCPEPGRRLDAALFEAGLAAERGLNLWRFRRRLIAAQPPLLEALPELRSVIFGGVRKGEDVRFGLSLFSPLRAFGTLPMRLVGDRTNLTLSWPAADVKPSSVTLASAFPIKVSPRMNLAEAKLAQAFGFTDLRYTPTIVGDCEVNLTLPSWATAIPVAAPTPEYQERRR